MDYEEVLCDANTLYKAYKASIRGSKWKESTQRFALNYLPYIFEIQGELRNRTLANSPTNEFSLRERGKIRPISSLAVKDRIVRHAACDEILMPAIKRNIIYDNSSSIKGRGVSHARTRFEVHLHKYYKKYGNAGYILLGDFTKFYDNVVHETAKRQLSDLLGNDEFMDWLIALVFDGFKIDASYMAEAEYKECLYGVFDKLKYRDISKEKRQGQKYIEKSINMGDQFSQGTGAYYLNRIDTYVKYVRQQEFYARYSDDWYIMNPSKEELFDILENIKAIAAELGIHINEKKTRIVKISGEYRYLQILYSLSSEGKISKRINPTRVVTMRRKLKKLASKADRGEIPYCSVEETFRSWMGDHYKLMSRRKRKNMIALFEELFHKRIVIVGKKMLITDIM